MIVQPEPLEEEIKTYLPLGQPFGETDLNYHLTQMASEPYIQQLCERWLPGGHASVGFWLVSHDAARLIVDLEHGQWAYFDVVKNYCLGMPDIISLVAFLFREGKGDALNRTAAATAKLIRNAN